MRHSLLLVAVVLGVVACGGRGGQRTDLHIAIQLPTKRLTFELHCDPAGGTVPSPEMACAMLAGEPVMLNPPAMTATCAGSFGIPPEITVTGAYRGKPVNVDVRGCDHPPATRGHSADLWQSLLLPHRTR